MSNDEQPANTVPATQAAGERQPEQDAPAATTADGQGTDAVGGEGIGQQPSAVPTGSDGEGAGAAQPESSAPSEQPQTIIDEQPAATPTTEAPQTPPAQAEQPPADAAASTPAQQAEQQPSAEQPQSPQFYGPIKDTLRQFTKEERLQSVLDDLKHYQRTALACQEDDQAIRRLEVALQWMERRTSLRQMQSVLGTQTPHKSVS